MPAQQPERGILCVKSALELEDCLKQVQELQN
jgi:hypothetical protein